MTNFTSLVAVDKTPARIKEKLIKQNIKRNLPSGWDTKEVNAPRTATNSRLFLILALVLFSLAIFTNSFLRRLEDANSKI
jgi:Ca-activated chloride channel family protein